MLSTSYRRAGSCEGHEAGVQGQGDRPAVTVLLQRALRTDKRDWPKLQIQTLDEAPPGSVIVEVLEDGLDTAGVGNLMATTAKVRGLAGMVIDGGARDVEEIEEIGFPVWSRSQTPATSVGRYVPVAKNVPVMCGGVAVRPGDWIVADKTGVVVVPSASLPQVLKLLRQYDDKETKMVPLIKETKSMGKALEKSTVPSRVRSASRTFIRKRIRMPVPPGGRVTG